MTTPPSLQTYRDQLAGTDQTLYLGRLVWYSVSAMSFDHQALCLAMHDVGLGRDLPRPPSDVDVFRRACTAAKKNRMPTSDPAVYSNYTVRDVGADKDKLYKKIVRETVDTAGRKLSHDSDMCDLQFDKVSGHVDIICNGTDDLATAMAREIEISYHAEQGMITAYTVRESIIRRILQQELKATNVRGPAGGVYFVSEEYGPQVEALEKLAALITKPTKSGDDAVIVHSLELVDNSKQRSMVRKAFEAETRDAVAELTDEIADLTKSGKKISPDLYRRYLDRYDFLTTKANEYASLLEDSLDFTNSQLSVFQRVIMKLNLAVDAS